MPADPDPPPLAAVSFAYDIDDLFDVAMRGIRGQRSFHLARWRFATMSGLVAAAIAFLLFLDRANHQRLLISLATLIAVTAICHWSWRVAMARRVRHFLAASWQPGEHVCDVRLHEHALRLVAPGLELEWPWADIGALRGTGEDIEIWCGPHLAVVRGRGFAQPSDRAAFLQVATERIAQSRSRPGEG